MRLTETLTRPQAAELLVGELASAAIPATSLETILPSISVSRNAGSGGSDVASAMVPRAALRRTDERAFSRPEKTSAAAKTFRK